MPRPFSIVIHARTGERRKYPINRESNSPDTPRNPINFPSPALFPPISTVFTTREHNLSCCFRINFTQSFADSLLNSFKVNILRDAIKNSKRFAWFPLPFFFLFFPSLSKNVRWIFRKFSPNIRFFDLLEVIRNF